MSKTCCLQLWLECVDDKFSKPSKSCFSEDVVYNFVVMFKESKH